MNHLKLWLRARGMTADELARRTGVNRSLIYKYMRGDVRPRYETYVKIRRVTGDEIEFETFHRPKRPRAA